jgi:chaperone BCS1
MRGWYVERGIPYRRGYMLEGLPGTGKTSLVRALAGELGLDLYYLNLNAEGLSSQQLDELLRTTSERAIIVLEEVDEAFKKLAEEEIAAAQTKAQAQASAAEATEQVVEAVVVGGSARSPNEEDAPGTDLPTDAASTADAGKSRTASKGVQRLSFGTKTPRKRQSMAPPSSAVVTVVQGRNEGATIGRGSLDLTGILTAFDGLWSQEGRLVFSTTNNYRDIAAIRQGALVRCGRFGDYRLHFTALTHHQAQQLYRHFYKPGHYRSDGVIKSVDVADDETAAAERTTSTNEVQEQAVQFADLIQRKLLDNTAIPTRRKVYNSVQSFLMTRGRSDRNAALDAAIIDEWITSLIDIPTADDTI